MMSVLLECNVDSNTIAPPLLLKVKPQNAQKFASTYADVEDAYDDEIDQFMSTNEATVSPKIFSQISKKGTLCPPGGLFHISDASGQSDSTAGVMVQCWPDPRIKGGEDSVFFKHSVKPNTSMPEHQRLGCLDEWMPEEDGLVSVSPVAEHELPLIKHLFLIGPLNAQADPFTLPSAAVVKTLLGGRVIRDKSLWRLPIYPHLLGDTNSSNSVVFLVKCHPSPKGTWVKLKENIEPVFRSEEDELALESVNPFFYYDKHCYMLQGLIKERIEGVDGWRGGVLVVGGHGVGKRSLVRSVLSNPGCSMVFEEVDILFDVEREDEGPSSDVFKFLQLFNNLPQRVVPIGITSRLMAIPSLVRECFEEVISVDIPSPEKRFHIFRACINNMSLSIDREVSVRSISDKCHGFVGADIMAICRDAALIAAKRQNNKPEITNEDFTTALEGVRPSGLREAGFTLALPTVKWEDVGGLDEVKQRLREAIIWAHENRDALQRMAITPPKGILLYGPPGTGKTLICAAVAAEAKANFLPISIPDLLRSEMGESEKYLAEIFRRARENKPCILFFDEIQAIFSHRDSSSASSKTMVSQLVLEMDASPEGVTVIGATNWPGAMDRSFMHAGRFELQIYVPPPDLPARRSILQVLTRGMALGTDVSLEFLAANTANCTGADLKDLCRLAAIHAITLDKDTITFEDFFYALGRFSPSLDAQSESKFRDWTF